MFSGIIYEIGTVKQIKKRTKSWSYHIQAGKTLARTKVGSSVAVNGACLTVTKKEPRGFWVDIVAETMRRTYFGKCRVGTKVNLEPSLRPFDELGGHLVQGHVDGVGKIKDIFDTKHDLIYTIELPKKLMRYVANKGFIAVDGVSLTGLNPDTVEFQVAIIPHTKKHTIFQFKKKGDPVNIEVDMMAKYLERLLPRK